jgi:hypothetical protein
MYKTKFVFVIDNIFVLLFSLKILSVFNKIFLKNPIFYELNF